MESEKSILLSVSNDIAAVRDIKDLQKVITNRLKQLFCFNDITIILYDQQADQYSRFLQTTEQKRNHDPGFADTFTKYTPAADGIVNRTLQTLDPVLFNVAELTKMEKPPLYVHFYAKTGIKEFVGVSMRSGNVIFGGLFLFSESLDTYYKNTKLIRAVADQLSIAVANILANEEIIKKGKENSILLSLSNAIATIRNKEDLFHVINEKLKAIFPFEDFVICLIDEDQQTHSAFLYNRSKDFQSNPGIAPVEHAKYTLDDGLCRLMMTAEKPIVFDVAEMMEWPDAPVWLGFWHDLGIKEMIGFSIMEGGKCTGFFFLYAKAHNAISNEYYNLLNSIGLQVSVAISNIRANEKIEKQLKEIDAYKLQLEEEKIYLQQQIETTHNYGEIVGSGQAMQQVFHLVNQVAPSDSTVLILGETGTGKELIARAIHNSSPRKDKLMVKINCATLPTHLIESELFGHEKGSFTGATERRIGKFELANNGTLFLDEIGELALDLQVKLLRVLQEKEIERIGGKSVIKINVRIIAATNRILAREVTEGTFRSDLFYRLNVYPIPLPALREHKEDIPALAGLFTARYAQKSGKNIRNITQSVLKKLQAYHWPGNIRELEHLIERSVLLTNGPVIAEVQLPKTEKRGPSAESDDIQIKSIYENERDHILSILRLCKGKISGTGGAAELLDIPATTLNSKIKKFNIKREHILK